MRKSYVIISTEQYERLLSNIRLIEKQTKKFVEYVKGEPFEDGKFTHESYMREINEVLTILENDNG